MFERLKTAWKILRSGRKRRRGAFGYYQKIILAITLVTLVTSSAVGVVSYVSAAAKSREARLTLDTAYLTAAASDINLIFSQLKTMPYNVLFNEGAAFVLTADSTGMSYNEEYDTLHPVASSLRGNSAAVHSILFFTRRGKNYSYPALRELRSESYESCVRRYEAGGVDLLSQSIYWDRVDRVFGMDTSPYICGTCLYRDYYTLEGHGLIMVIVREAVLNNLLTGLSGDVWVVNEAGECMLSNGSEPPPDRKELTEAFRAKEGLLVNDGGDRKLLTAISVPSAGWYIVSRVEYGSLFEETRAIFNTILLALITSVAVALLLATVVSNQLTNNLHRLTGMMRKAADGCLTVRCPVSGDDEISYLSGQFNNMLDHLELYVEQLRRQEKQQMRAEMKLQQARINPHLLYNSLDSIVWKLEQGNFKDASASLEAMSEFFKLSLSKGRILVPVSQEIELVKNYIELQNRCRNKSHRLTVEADEGLLAAPIVKMTLQPIVENSILHGFDGYRNSGEIRIGVRRGALPDTIQLTIWDNGQGMLPETLEALNRLESVVASGWAGDESLHHFGIHSVFIRLRHFFGDQSTLCFESEYMEYTQVTLTFPIIRDEEQINMTE